MPYKDDLDADIADSLRASSDPLHVARRLFEFRASPVLQANAAEAFAILDEVANRFAVPFRSVVVVGSAHTGYTYHKQRDFVPGESDLDLAIISAQLFCRYSEFAFQITKGYRDLTRFKDVTQAQSFQSYLSKGIFRPDMMPDSPAKQDWQKFFNRLTMKHNQLFRDVNCGVYQSDVFFEAKQASIVELYKKGKP